MSTFNKYRTKGAFHWEWYKTEDWYKYLVDRCVKFCNGSTVDIGCGDGLLTDKIADKYRTDVLGLDKDLDGLKLAMEKSSNASFQRFDIDEYETNPKNPKYEYLACLNTIEHLHHPEKIKQFIRDNITKGAIITTIDYQGGTLGEDHKFEWTYDEMMDFFKEFNPKGFRYKDTEWIGVEITK